MRPFYRVRERGRVKGLARIERSLMLHLVIVVAMLVAAFQAVRSARLMASVIWLVCASALLALEFYALGAQTVAVLELSIGAGLVSVLLVFAITIAGDEQPGASTVVPIPLAAALVIVIALLAAISSTQAPPRLVAGAAEAPFSIILWEQRGLDALAQIGLIFAGALGLLGLLSEHMPGTKAATAAAMQADTPHESHEEVPEAAAHEEAQILS